MRGTGDVISGVLLFTVSNMMNNQARTAMPKNIMKVYDALTDLRNDFMNSFIDLIESSLGSFPTLLADLGRGASDAKILTGSKISGLN